MADLQKFGAPISVLQQFDADGEDTEQSKEVIEIEVWFVNIDAVEVWMRCSPVIVTFAGTCGVTAVEIDAVAGMLGVKVNKDMLDDIRLLAGTADELRNKRR